MIKINKGLVTIIFPFYDVEKYIKKSLESVLNQTYNNLEIIIVNDGSKDNSKDIIKKYIENNIKIKYIEQENKGIAEARNIGLKNANGEYIMFVDSDDFIDVNAVEKMHSSLMEKKSNICICAYQLYYENNKNKTKIIKHNIEGNVLYGNEEIQNNILSGKIKCYTCMKLFKKTLLDKIDFKFEKGRLYEDFVPLFKLLTNGEKISFVNDSIYYYRQIETSITSKKSLKTINDYSYAVNQVLQYMKYRNISADEKSMMKFKIDVYANLIRKYIRNINKNPQKQFIMNDNNIVVNLLDIIKNNEVLVKDKIICLLWKLKLNYILKTLL